MATEKSRFGLSRNIPSAVKREVRRRCGFGCVVCGEAIFLYDHFSPEFIDARVHVANGIALLCGTHDRKKGSLLSEEAYARCRRSPAALAKGFSSTYSDWSDEPFAPEILLGSFTFAGGTSILRIGDELLLGFEPPEELGAPPGLNFRVFDRRGVESFAIIANEIRCQNDAFDIEAVGPKWKVRSALRKIDLVIRFDPPTRITIEKLHFKYLRWELVAEGGTFEVRFDGQPIVTYLGGAKIRGPCLLTLAENEPHVSSSDMQITFGSGPSPIGTQPTDTGFRVLWPVYCPVDPADNRMFITDLHGYRTLGLYTRRSLAEAACPDRYQIFALSNYQVCKIVDDYGNRNLIELVAFNPSQETTSAYRWPDFTKNIEAGQNNVLRPIEEGETLANDYDDGPVAFQFPIYLFIRAEPQTSYHEIEVAVIQNAGDIVPIFTKKEYAEAAKAVLVGDYRIEKLEKNEFIKFLRHVILPRYIELLTLNPDLASERGVIRPIKVADMITDLEADMTDQEIEELVKKGKMKEI